MAAAIATSRCAVLALMAWALAGPAPAQEVPPPAYQVAARQVGIPSSVLYAVALQESGTRLNRRLVPWPWTLNVAGVGRRFPTQAKACAHLHLALRVVPPTRIDVGLGQINLSYQRHRYSRPCELLAPYRNLAIAADILREQHVPGQDWLITVGRYHRPAGGAPAARYRRSVGQHLARVLNAPQLNTTAQRSPP